MGKKVTSQRLIRKFRQHVLKAGNLLAEKITKLFDEITWFLVGVNIEDSNLCFFFIAANQRKLHSQPRVLLKRTEKRGQFSEPASSHTPNSITEGADLGAEFNKRFDLNSKPTLNSLKKIERRKKLKH